MIHINLVTNKYPLHGSGNNLSQVCQCHKKVVSLRTLLLPLQQFNYDEEMNYYEYDEEKLTKLVFSRLEYE